MKFGAVLDSSIEGGRWRWQMGGRRNPVLLPHIEKVSFVDWKPYLGAYTDLLMC